LLPSCDSSVRFSKTASTEQCPYSSVPFCARAVDGCECNCLNTKQWALNSAVECHLHTSSRSNTFNNLTSATGTAKYLKVRARQADQRVRLRVLSA
jgi:hypothetical protein